MARLPAELTRIALRPSDRPTPPRLLDGSGSANGSGPVRSVSVPEIPMPDGPVARPDLVVATVLDPFSAACFRYEWQQIEPGPDDWRALFERQRPDLLFVESVWNGNEGRWKGAMTGSRAPWPQLQEMVAWCREQGIPTVFWNKEDPPNYEKFIDSARLFDHVLTVDEDCVERYRADLGHDRVGVLPFAAQPRIHNPIRPPGARAYEVAFAGTYFAEKHPGRREQVETVLDPAREFDLHIFSRMDGVDARYRFPERFTEHVVGSLSYEQMLTAYKLYKVFLNITSVTESATTCSRRVFELAACGTPVLSAAARGVEAMFGELVPTTSSAEQTAGELAGLLASAELRDRLAHRALRTVLAGHTYGHRADEVLRQAGLPVTRSEPGKVSVLAATNRPHQLDHLLTQVARQTYPALQLVLVLHGFPAADAVADAEARARAAGITDVVVRTAPAETNLGACLNIALDASDGAYVAKLDDDNYYGPEFLSDLVDAFTYTDAKIVGKWAHYVHLEATEATVLRFARLEHRYVDKVQGGTIVADAALAHEVRFGDLPRGVDTDFLARSKARGALVYSADRYNFVSVRRGSPGAHTWQINDAELLARSSQVAFYGPAEAHVTV
jgi:hypothetical protein